MYLPASSAEAITDAIAGMNLGKGHVVLVLLCEKSLPDVHALIESLNRLGVSFMGGIFPGVIRGNAKYDTGAVLIPLPADEPPLLITGMDRDVVEVPFCDRLAARVGKNRTAIVFVDGFAPNIASVLEDLFGCLGNSVHYLGSGAGFLSIKKQPCIFTNEGFFENAASVVFAKCGSCLGARHGWERLGEPVVATKTRRNVIVNLNWRNALEVYREIVEADCGKKLHADERFYGTAANYPFGIVKEAAEDVVRDPFSANDRGEITCIGDIPENAVLNILKYKPQSLVAAAGQAVRDCLGGASRRRRQALVFDCVSRAILLKDHFTAELDSVNRTFQELGPGTVPEGMLSLGEICSYGEGYLDYFNKTIVVGMLYDA